MKLCDALNGRIESETHPLTICYGKADSYMLARSVVQLLAALLTAHRIR
jgi:hypothetical protein